MNRFWQKKGLLKGSILLMALSMLWLPTQAQVMKTMTFSGEDGAIFMLPEVGGVVSESEDGPSVIMVLPADHRLEDYKTLDIQVGDIIKMFNGKSMKEVSTIQEVYDALKIGDEVKFGIRRDKGMLMVKYAKMDPKDSPAKMMVSTIGGPSGGDMGNMISELIELGLIVDNVNGKMIVVDVITEIESVFIGTQPDNDDQLIKIQSQNIKSVEHLSQIYENIKAGDKASMTMLRSGEEITLEFKKPNADQCPVKTKVKKKQGQ